MEINQPVPPACNSVSAQKFEKEIEQATLGLKKARDEMERVMAKNNSSSFERKNVINVLWEAIAHLRRLKQTRRSLTIFNSRNTEK